MRNLRGKPVILNSVMRVKGKQFKEGASEGGAEVARGPVTCDDGNLQEHKLTGVFSRANDRHGSGQKKKLQKIIVRILDIKGTRKELSGRTG